MIPQLPEIPAPDTQRRQNGLGLAIQRQTMLTKVKKWGNGQGLRLTKALLHEAGIHVGDEVNLSVRSGRIVVEPIYRVRGRYDLEALISKMPERYQAEELDWGPPAGREVW